MKGHLFFKIGEYLLDAMILLSLSINPVQARQNNINQDLHSQNEVDSKYLFNINNRLPIYPTSSLINYPNLSSINLAPNPSFEIGTDSPLGWFKDVFRGNALFGWDGTTGHASPHSVSIKNLTSQANVGWETIDYINIDPTHDYMISAWYKNTTSRSSVAFLAIMWGTAPYAYGSTGIWGMEPSDEWKFRNMIITSDCLQEHFSGVNRVQLHFGISSVNPESGGVWIDDISFIDLSNVAHPFLDLPIEYSDFSEEANGNIGNYPGRVNSWFDHESPNYTYDDFLNRWDGARLVDLQNVRCTSGVNCYDGHNGVDFSHNLSIENESIFAASKGTVFGVIKNCIQGDKGCGNGYGNQVWINHNNGYVTLYGHLSTVLVSNGDVITDPYSNALGTMGNTGNSTGTHLHFGVYYDQNSDSNWSIYEVVDPYGWQASTIDPWSKQSSYLWLHPLSAQYQINSSGGSSSTPSGNMAITVPAGAVSGSITMELWDTSPFAGASATLRSTGFFFWMHILEWLNGSSSSSPSALSDSFIAPVTITVHYDTTSMIHLDTDQLTINQWDDVSQTWVSLPTTLDTENKQASAQTSQQGHFDLQAPLVCPADILEPNDNYNGSSIIQTDGELVSNLFDVASDEDWFKFSVIEGGQYTIKTVDLVPGVDTLIAVYDQNGITQLASNRDSGGNLASTLVWQANENGTFFIQVSQNTSSIYGCTASYRISVTGEFRLHLPFIVH